MGGFPGPHPRLCPYLLEHIGKHRRKPKVGKIKVIKIVGSVPSQQPEANALVTIQYASIETQIMEEHKGGHSVRKHEQIQNHSLATMSTTEIVIILTTKNVSPKLAKSGSR